MKAKMILLPIILVSVVVFCGAMFAMRKHLTDYNTALKANWKISIPAKAHYTEIYSKDSGPSFQGDGLRYHIFSYNDRSYIGEMLDWESDEKETIFNGDYSDTVNVWLDAIEVPAEYRPDYAGCLYWYNSQEDNSEIIILWDEGSNTIYVVESFF